ncbi:MAG: hypothetical protein HKN34_07380, partial [Gammaproteobacteria bacterium]|nr:hypothetical protein [Gammaproteobacteria bacterium]
LKGPYYAAGVVAVLAILSVFFPLVSGSPFLGALLAMVLTYTAGSLVGLIILTQGVQSGLKAIVVSVLVVTVVAAVVLKAPGLGISIAVVQWLPVVILAQTLRITNSLSLTMLAGLVPGAVGVILQFTIWPNLEAEWAALVQKSLTQLSQGQEITQVDMGEQIRQMMHWLILMLAASLYVLYVSIVMIARWMQARVAGSEGYRKEFRNLALGKPAAMVAIALMVMSMWINQDWVISMTIMVTAAFLFQGIAVVHARILSGKFRPMLTGLFYMLLLIIPQVMAFTAIAGIIDNWLKFRKREDMVNPPD